VLNRASGQAGAKPQLDIGKEGYTYLRTVMVQGAHYTLGRRLEKTAISGVAI
jgi:hypothetical protein